MKNPLITNWRSDPACTDIVTRMPGERLHDNTKCLPKSGQDCCETYPCSIDSHLDTAMKHRRVASGIRRRTRAKTTDGSSTLAGQGRGYVETLNVSPDQVTLGEPKCSCLIRSLRHDENTRPRPERTTQRSHPRRPRTSVLRPKPKEPPCVPLSSLLDILRTIVAHA